MDLESHSESVLTVQQLTPPRYDFADLLIAYLRQLGVDYVFGIPGGAIEPLYNALARSERSNGPRSIVARHETGAAFMAAGYAQNTAKLGVCCATTGPGATNLITGVASAYENNIPLLVITAQTSLENFGRSAFQESSCTSINIVGMFQFCTTYNTLISHPNQFERKLCAAIMTAIRTSRPVHISIPLDVLRGNSFAIKPNYSLDKIWLKPILIDNHTFVMLMQKIQCAKNIILVLGEGCAASMQSILQFAQFMNIKILTTPHGKGLINANHRLYYGVIGFAGHHAAVRLLSNPEIDLILVVGTRLSEWASNAWDATLLNSKLVHIDELERNFVNSPMAEFHVFGSIQRVFDKLSQYFFVNDQAVKFDLRSDLVADDSLIQLRKFMHDEEEKFYKESTPIKPQRLMNDLASLFPPNTKFLADVGNSMAWAIHYLHPKSNSESLDNAHNNIALLSCLEFAPMGWAIGASIGVALSNFDNPVVCITGDGSFLMSGQEITVALQENITVIFVILNDAELGMVKHGQRLANAESIAYRLPTVDYSKFAKSMGIMAHTIRSSKDLCALDMNKICQHKGPTLLDVRIDAEEVPPMKMRMNVLRAA